MAIPPPSSKFAASLMHKRELKRTIRGDKALILVPSDC